jgi:hypothetical protein
MKPRDEKRERDARKGPASGTDDPRPAGNAQFDPAQQSKRLDIPEDEQQASGEPTRGSEPSREPDRSRQPHRHDDPGAT